MAALPPIGDSLRTEWRQVSARRAVNGTSFPGAPIDFTWEVSGADHWDPQASFLRIRMKLLGPGDRPLTVGDGVAPSMFAGSTLFQSMEHRIEETTVSRIDNYCGLVDAMRHRSELSKAQMDSLCKSTNFSQPELAARIADVAWDAKKNVEGGYITPGSSVDRVQLGFDAATNTIAYAIPAAGENVGTITFAQNGGAALPTLATYFSVGDYIQIAQNSPMLITALASATTLSVIPLDGSQAAIGAAGAAFERLRGYSAIVAGRQAGLFEIIYRPPLGVWAQPDSIPCSSHRLVLQPQTSAQLGFNFVESLVAKTAGTDYSVSVEDMILEVCVRKLGEVPDGDMSLDLREVQLQTAVNLSASSGQNNFQVPRSTYKLAVAYNDTRSESQTNVPSTKLIVGTPGQHIEQALNRLQISYAGQVQPANPSEPAIDPQNVAAGNKDWAVMQYYKSLLCNEATADTGGCESVEQFRERGSYYAYLFHKPRGVAYTDCQVTASFNSAYPNFSVDNLRLCLFAYYSQAAKLRISGGKVSAVSVEQV